MTSAEVGMLRTEIVDRLEKIELGLFGEDGLGGLGALVKQHLEDHRRKDEVAAVGASTSWPRRFMRQMRDNWPFVVIAATLASVLIDLFLHHLTIVLN